MNATVSIFTPHQKLIDEGFAPGKKSFDFLAKEILENFDFEMLHNAMIAVKWVWYFGVDKLGHEQHGIPNIDTIQHHAYSILKDVYDSGKSISIGGFSAGWDGNEMYIVFNLCESSTNGIVSPLNENDI